MLVSLVSNTELRTLRARTYALHLGMNVNILEQGTYVLCSFFVGIYI